ncbi:MAG: cytosolic protein [Candidatus Kapabacteria bacterium]|jgi:hypothetical protein|nr:cytosolic protein [Candidatus Kapabacteria bacterium]
MSDSLTKQITLYVEEHIDSFHTQRFEKLQKLNLKEVLKRKNPYLFKAKNILTAQDLVQGIVDAYLQSQEETLFGTFIEGVAIFVCQQVYGGKKSTTLEGIDLEFEKDGAIWIVEVKSGPNWANSSQIKKMRQNFVSAKRQLRQHNPNTPIIAVNGCCYGKDNKPYKKQHDYFKYCGQEFWQLISGRATLFTDIIEPLAYHAKEKNEQFLKMYAKVINTFTLAFAQEFCQDGEIDWEKLVVFNSAKRNSSTNK